VPTVPVTVTISNTASASGLAWPLVWLLTASPTYTAADMVTVADPTWVQVVPLDER
jgi:hypothetical protein